MKQVLSTTIALFSFIFSFAAPVNTASTGNWNNTSTWNLGRLPIDGDTLVIPTGVIVTVDANIMNTSNNFYIKVVGELHFNGGKLDMGVNSKILVYTSATITGSSASDVLRINSVDKFKGSQSAIVGPAFATSSTSVAPNGFTASTNAALPVVFIGFNVARQDNDVLIQWSTAQEINSARYEVERSEDGAMWSSIATLAAAGNSNTIQSYSFTDRNVAKGYYRIKQVDQDGRFTYTAVKAIKATNSTVVMIASLTQNSLVLQFSQQLNTTVSLRIIALSGAVVAERQIERPVGQVVVNIPALKGNYIVSISNNQDVSTHAQILF
jgi:hypothetical protein